MLLLWLTQADEWCYLCGRHSDCEFSEGVLGGLPLCCTVPWHAPCSSSSASCTPTLASITGVLHFTAVVLWLGDLLGWSTSKIIQAQIPFVGSPQSIGRSGVLATPYQGKLPAVCFLQLFSPYQISTGENKPVSVRARNVYPPFLLASLIFISDYLGIPLTWTQGRESIPPSFPQRRRGKPLTVTTVVFSHKTNTDHSSPFF